MSMLINQKNADISRVNLQICKEPTNLEIVDKLNYDAEEYIRSGRFGIFAKVGGNVLE